ncbi:glycosyltransferase 61 family protein [Lutimaribacter marinistellae]|uniref:Glycosyltransferase 61 family protein n=1 Tax=Lutimaribacter marinistellae TaxID=1820329 RepID=A0ABV7TAZ5_9RHOB
MSAANIEILGDAIVIPSSHYTPPRPKPEGGGVVSGVFGGGAYRSSGAWFARGESVFNSHVNQPPQEIDPAVAETTMKGRYLYLGLLQNAHFGHFISENISRLWGADLLSELDGVIYYALFPDQPVHASVLNVLQFLLPGIPLIRVDRPTRFENLFVPASFRFPAGFVAGHPLMRDFAARRVARARDGRPAGPKKVFVSRAALAREGARFVLETEIDRNMRAQGYTVLHPEKHGPAEQLRHYADAEKLVFSEGSALHLYALGARPGQEVFIIWRRKTVFPVFERQITSFGGPVPVGDNHVMETLFHRKFPGANARAQCLLDFAGLGRDLASRGFIGDGWTVPPVDALLRELENLSDAFDVTQARAALDRASVDQPDTAR